MNEGLNGVVLQGLMWIWLVLCWADVIVKWRSSHEFYVEWSYWFELTYCICSLILAAGAVWFEPWSAAMFLFCAAVSGWRWWNNDHNKRKRKKLADKAAGVVRDAGGRLKVVRPATGTTR